MCYILVSSSKYYTNRNVEKSFSETIKQEQNFKGLLSKRYLLKSEICVPNKSPREDLPLKENTPCLN